MECRHALFVKCILQRRKVVIPCHVLGQNKVVLGFCVLLGWLKIKNSSQSPMVGTDRCLLVPILCSDSGKQTPSLSLHITQLRQ